MATRTPVHDENLAKLHTALVMIYSIGGQLKNPRYHVAVPPNRLNEEATNKLRLSRPEGLVIPRLVLFAEGVRHPHWYNEDTLNPEKARSI